MKTWNNWFSSKGTWDTMKLHFNLMLFSVSGYAGTERTVKGNSGDRCARLWTHYRCQRCDSGRGTKGVITDQVPIRFLKMVLAKVLHIGFKTKSYAQQKEKVYWRDVGSKSCHGSTNCRVNSDGLQATKVSFTAFQKWMWRVWPKPWRRDLLTWRYKVKWQVCK